MWVRYESLGSTVRLVALPLLRERRMTRCLQYKGMDVIRLTLCVSLARSLARGAPTPLIVDTDIGGGGCRDVDDVLALSVAHALADQGLVQLLAVVQNTQAPASTGVISVVNTYYGRHAVPVGVYRGTDLKDLQALSYVPDLVANWPSPVKNSSQVGSAVDLYRRVLASQRDGSVTVASIGLLTNLAALFHSGPDAHSALDGHALFARKVRRLAIMGGRYPSSGHAMCECNFCASAYGGLDHAAASRASSYAVDALPTMASSVHVVFVGLGVGLEVVSGSRLSSCAPTSNPARAALRDYEGAPSKGRFSWDPITVVIASLGRIDGLERCEHCDGVNAVNGQSGANGWLLGAFANQSYMVLRNATATTQALDQLLCQTPRARRGLSIGDGR